MSLVDTSTSFHALGTTASILVTNPVVLKGAAEILRAEIDAIDVACSRFRSDSELAAVNAAAGRPVRISRLLVEAIDAALRAARVTDGRVDPTVGSAMRVLGYDRDFAEMAATGPEIGVRVGPVAGWRCVHINRPASTVEIPAGVYLDLGATAKALCADRAAAAIAQFMGGRGRGGVLVSLGGDIAVAGVAPPEGWNVRITHDHADPPDAPGQTVAISSGGLATSSTSVRRWARGGQALHHLIDPATGRPATECWRTVSVAAGSCVDANIASTAAVILGPDAPGWLTRRHLPARLVDPAGAITAVAGWPTDIPIA